MKMQCFKSVEYNAYSQLQHIMHFIYNAEKNIFFSFYKLYKARTFSSGLKQSRPLKTGLVP